MKQKPYFLACGLICAAMIATGCGKTQNTPPAKSADQPPTTTTIIPTTDDKLAQDTALSNPATVYCLQQNGKFAMQKALDGTTEGLCTLQDGITCEVWAFYQGNCPAGSKHRNLFASSSTPSVATTTTSNSELPTSTMAAVPAKLPSQDSLQNDLGQLDLTAQAGDPGNITTSWATNGLRVHGGFIVMLSGKPEITYPGVKYSEKIGNPNSRSYVWDNLVAGRTYYFRVCIAEGDVCQTYSQVVSATAK